MSEEEGSHQEKSPEWPPPGSERIGDAYNSKSKSITTIVRLPQDHKLGSRIALTTTDDDGQQRTFVRVGLNYDVESILMDLRMNDRDGVIGRVLKDNEDLNLLNIDRK